MRAFDIGVDMIVGRVDEALLADLQLARIALGVWQASTRAERRVAELRGLLARMSSRPEDEPRRRAIQAYLDDQLRCLPDAPLEPDSAEDAIRLAELARAGLVERYLGLVAGMVEALGQAAHGRVLDLVGSGNAALVEAARMFAPGPHAGRDQFEEYARERVERALAEAMQQPPDPVFMIRSAMDPISQLLIDLGASSDPDQVWNQVLLAKGDDLIAAAWRESRAPISMVRLLALIQSAEIDVAAQAVLRTAAEILERTDPDPGRDRVAADAVAKLTAASCRPTAYAELSHLLVLEWASALPDGRDRRELEGVLAASIRHVVRKPPRLADFETPRRPERPMPATRAVHLADALRDPTRLRVIDRDTVLRSCRGRVISPEAYGRYGPELGGLFCERIFGRWHPRANITRDDRDEHWGYVELSIPCEHPIIAGASLSLVPIVPPHFRRHLEIGVEELQTHARNRRAHLERQPDLCDSAEKILAEEGLSDPEALTGPGIIEHPLNTVYRELINRDRRWRRLTELGAPQVVVEKDVSKMASLAQRLVLVWRTWATELSADIDASWALRSLALEPCR